MRTVARWLAIGLVVAGGAMTVAAAEQPVAWWKFDAADAQAVPAARGPWVADGKIGGALALAGGSYVKAGKIGTFDALTIALWVRPDALDHAFNVLLACEGWDRSMVHLQLAQDGHVEFSVNGNKPVDQFSAATPGKNLGAWTHVAVAYDGKAKIVCFYVNGKPDKVSSYKSAWPVQLNALRLGAWDKEPRLLTGRIDDVRIYSQALNAAAVARVAAGEELKDGLEAWWRMDEKEGTKVADASGQGRDAALVLAAGGGTTLESIAHIADEVRGPPKFVPGVDGNALRFDGSVTTVIRQAAQAPKINPEGFSIEAWVALASKPRSGCAIVERQRERRGYFLGVDGDGRLSLQFALAREWKECVSLAPVPLGKWVHVAATYSPDSGINLYLNGQPTGNLVLLGPLWFAEDADLVIGRSFSGLIDNLVIHNAELSPKEVSKHYEAGRAAPEPAFGP